jgi:hypothetical protein
MRYGKLNSNKHDIMKDKYQYYRMKRFNKSFYAKDGRGNIYFLSTYSCDPDCWQKATWKNEIESGKSCIDVPDEIELIDEYELKKAGVPLITPKNLKNQPLYKYYQDVEEDWIYYAEDEKGDIYIYRDPRVNAYVTKKPSGKWEKINDPDFLKYCRENIGLMSQTDPRTEEHILKKGIPLIEDKDIIECADNHIHI